MLSALSALLSSSGGVESGETTKADVAGAATESSRASTHTASDSHPTSSGMPDISGMLGAILQNPEMIGAIMQLLPTISKITAKPPTSAEQSSGEVPTLSLMPPQNSYKRPAVPTDRRSALLLALKPYMSQEKADMIDTIVRIIEIMSHIK